MLRELEVEELEGGRPAGRVRPEALAWLVLVLAFAVFCVVAGVGVLMVRGYLETASEAQTAKVAVINGTLLVQPPKQREWVGTAADTSLMPGARLRTDRGSEAFLTFFEYSTLRVHGDTELEVIGLSSSRFGPRRDFMELAVHGGKVHMGVAPALDGEKEIRFVTPHGSFKLEEGSYTLDVNNDRTQLRVAERGRAEARSKDAAFVLEPGQRIELGPRATGAPTQSWEDLVRNGNFGEGFTAWRPGNALGFPEGTDVVAQQSLTIDEGRIAVRFARGGSKGTHNESYLYQEINRDVSDFAELYLSLDVKLLQQSLSGGGYLGTEYPVLVRVNYRSAAGDGLAVYGFYYQNDARNRTDFGVVLPRGVWASYTTPVNLMALSPRPQRIASVQVGASGWDYESLVANVRLAGR